ncbi:hypothetical protein BX661DRAFT_178338 [Kickxella alabastrina]|uniref:uncharacterized protein n=1 Tax=Kickxella alabastrina TaxID=61397 RepID=UPI00221EFB81|nr:uncharacterized protein BX661DRAFT_178338 [Kickxella alabastrina]KAI7833411.1 hypothetical protein BX661DRAFT_178338 [Kickxella alabastrina]
MNCLTRTLVQTRQPVLVIQRGMKKKSKIPVTLLKDIPRVGSAGSVIQVNKAYMRHELYPKRMAEYVLTREGPLDRTKAVEKESGTAPSRTHVEAQQKVHSMALSNQETIGLIMKLQPLVFERKVVVAADGGAEEGVQAIYGSLAKTDVIKALAEEHGIVIDKDALSMDDKIKSVGEYRCVVKLIYAGQASFKAQVVPAKDESQQQQ